MLACPQPKANAMSTEDQVATRVFIIFYSFRIVLFCGIPALMLAGDLSLDMAVAVVCIFGSHECAQATFGVPFLR
jgi:hypothetical protein